jgi:hypothetical protein
VRDEGITRRRAGKIDKLAVDDVIRVKRIYPN